jgi:hypothetical protein
MNATFARKYFHDHRDVPATNRGICRVTLVAKRLFGHTNCKNILLRIETLESMDVSNVINNTLVSWNWFDI